MKTCGIRKRHLKGKDTFPDVFKRMMKWIKNTTRMANRKEQKRHRKRGDIGKEETYFPGMVNPGCTSYIKLFCVKVTCKIQTNGETLDSCSSFLFGCLKTAFTLNFYHGNNLLNKYVPS